MSRKESLKKTIPADLGDVCRRVREKISSYHEYTSSLAHNNFLKAFFDLTQEYDTLDDFYRICVSVPYEMTGMHNALYLCRENDEGLFQVCSSKQGVCKNPIPAAYPVQMHQVPYELAGSYIVPVYSKQPKTDKGVQVTEKHCARQARLWGNCGRLCTDGCLLGMYEIRSDDPLAEPDKLFYTKYAGRIGYSLDNRLIELQNRKHLQFINTLVADIEHNIIVPNMFYKHLFNQLRKKIEEIGEIRTFFQRDRKPEVYEQCCSMLQQIQDDLMVYHREIVKHYSSTSLFIESMLRREHFECGHLVLSPRRCFVEKEVIIPQLEHYASRLAAAHVVVERPANMISEEFALMVDKGLLAQVYANLFSNAAKYTQEIIDHQGTPRKAMAYGREIISNFLRPGQNGIKFNVFTTGPALLPDQGEKMFQEGVRGDEVQHIPGTGHGLAFIRHVVEMHGGVAGYEATGEGNNFYFILPMPPVEYPLVLVP